MCDVLCEPEILRAQAMWGTQKKSLVFFVAYTKANAHLNRLWAEKDDTHDAIFNRLDNMPGANEIIRTFNDTDFEHLYF